MKALDAFILAFPRLYIKQFPYAWIAFIALWTWPPNVSAVFLLIILIGLFMARWQYSAWLRKMRNEYAAADGKFYIDHPPMPIKRTVKNLFILIVASIVAAYFLQGPFRMTFWQVLLIAVGFFVMYRDSLFFGRFVTYIVTASGIAIYFAPGHLDFRPFLRFDEIAKFERCAFQRDKDWDDFSRVPNAKDGLLLIPKNPKGFTKRMWRLFIVPADIEKFLEQLPYGYK